MIFLTQEEVTLAVLGREQMNEATPQKGLSQEIYRPVFNQGYPWFRTRREVSPLPLTLNPSVSVSHFLFLFNLVCFPDFELLCLRVHRKHAVLGLRSLVMETLLLYTFNSAVLFSFYLEGVWGHTQGLLPAWAVLPGYA